MKDGQLVNFEVDSLLKIAYNKVIKHKDIGLVLNRGGIAAVEIKTCLEEAVNCVKSLAIPRAYVVPVSLGMSDKEILVQGEISISSKQLEATYESHGQAYIYLVSCGYDSRTVMAALNNDYVVYHFQNMLSRELLFAASREMYGHHTSQFPSQKHNRITLKMSDHMQETFRLDKKYWDADQVFQLFELIKDNPLGVELKPSGCFSPLHSLMGLILSC